MKPISLPHHWDLTSESRTGEFDVGNAIQAGITAKRRSPRAAHRWDRSSFVTEDDYDNDFDVLNLR